MKVVIIGGVAGGRCGGRLRRLDERAEIIILERTGYVSYANCGLPYYVGGRDPGREELTLQTPEGFETASELTCGWGRRRWSFTRSSIPSPSAAWRMGAPTPSTMTSCSSRGARPERPNLPGEDDPRVFTLRTVEDTLRIRAYLDEHPVRRAVVVGGGFIGLEMAENLVHAGVHTTLLQRGARCCRPWTPTWRRRSTPISGAREWSCAWAHG